MPNNKDKYIKNYINGELVAPDSKEHQDNFNPATGVVYSHIPDSGKKDIDLAVAAARDAFSQWSITPVERRSRILLRIADLLEQNLEEIAMAESIDNGKPLSIAKSIDIPNAIANFRFYATGAMHFIAEANTMEDMAINYTIRQPIGVVSVITPWNLPLYLFSLRVAPAIAAGNCVVAKPSEITPMTAYLLSEICMEAGLPPGVLNIIHGSDKKLITAIAKHPDIKAISFCGSTKTGNEIIQLTAPMFTKLSLEMGSKSPNIIFDDCDFDEMLRDTMRSSFSNQGQTYYSQSKIFVHQSIYEKFKNEFVARTEKLHVGDPLSPRTRQGAIPSEEHYNKILSYIKLAADEDGTILCGGGPADVPTRCKNGWFIKPTIIDDLKPNSKTNAEMVHGPVVVIMPFTKTEEVIKYANDSEYGLCASIWTENITKAHRVAQRLETGIIWINGWNIIDLRSPYGGSKHSGIGREGGIETFRFFTEPKNVCVKLK